MSPPSIKQTRSKQLSCLEHVRCRSGPSTNPSSRQPCSEGSITPRKGKARPGRTMWGGLQPGRQVLQWLSPRGFGRGNQSEASAGATEAAPQGPQHHRWARAEKRELGLGLYLAGRCAARKGKRNEAGPGEGRGSVGRMGGRALGAGARRLRARRHPASACSPLPTAGGLSDLPASRTHCPRPAHVSERPAPGAETRTHIFHVTGGCGNTLETPVFLPRGAVFARVSRVLGRPGAGGGGQAGGRSSSLSL